MTRPGRNRPSDPEPHSAASGRAGERLACRELSRRGFRIVARNVRTRFGEIDVLARRRRCWIAVEVKARRDHPAPERCVTATQLERLARSLRALAPELRPRPTRLRIDVVTVRWRDHSSRDADAADEASRHSDHEHHDPGWHDPGRHDPGWRDPRHRSAEVVHFEAFREVPLD